MLSIELKKLKVTYYNDNIVTVALDDLDATFIDGEIIAIVGPSGCGKTTLIRAICGFLDYEGEILADNEDYAQFDFKERNLAYVDQTIILNPNNDVYNCIASPLIINKVKRQEIDQRVKDIAKALGIEKYISLFPTQLSAGQNQLVQIAKALIKRPKLILLDEAFSGIDPESKKRLFNYIKQQHLEDRSTILFTTHSDSDIFELADRVAIMDKGKVISIINRDDKQFAYIKNLLENKTNDESSR